LENILTISGAGSSRQQEAEQGGKVCVEGAQRRTGTDDRARARARRGGEGSLGEGAKVERL